MDERGGPCDEKENKGRSRVLKMGEGSGESSRLGFSGVGIVKGLSVMSKEALKGEVGWSVGRFAVGSGGVSRLVSLVEGAMMETPRGGLQNDMHFASRC